MFRTAGLYVGLLFLMVLPEGAKGIEPPDAGRVYVLAKKGEHLPVGSVVESTSKEAMKDGDLIMKFGEEQMEGGMLMVGDEMRKLEVLGEGKRRLTILKATTKQKMIFDGEPVPIPDEEEPLVGKPVILTKKDGEWSAQLEKGKPGGEEKEELEELAEEFNNDADFNVYGDTPRKVGDEWEADGAKVMGMEGMEGKIKVKFTKVERYRGTECAVLDCSFKVVGGDEDFEGVEMMLKGKAKIYRSLKDLQDLQAEFTGLMEMNGLMNPAPGVEMEMKVKGEVTMDYVTKVTRPK